MKYMYITNVQYFFVIKSSVWIFRPAGPSPRFENDIGSVKLKMLGITYENDIGSDKPKMLGIT